MADVNATFDGFIWRGPWINFIARAFTARRAPNTSRGRMFMKRNTFLMAVAAVFFLSTVTWAGETPVNRRYSMPRN
jgi:hypothetical protein